MIIIGHNGFSFDGWVFHIDTNVPESDVAWLAHQIAILQKAQEAERAESLVVPSKDSSARRGQSSLQTDRANRDLRMSFLFWQ